MRAIRKMSVVAELGTNAAAAHDWRGWRGGAATNE